MNAVMTDVFFVVLCLGFVLRMCFLALCTDDIPPNTHATSQTALVTSDAAQSEQGKRFVDIATDGPPSPSSPPPYNAIV